MSHVESTRFLRPMNVRPTRRNYRQLQFRRALRFTANLLFASALLLALIWLYQRTQSDGRFAIRSVAIAGAVNTTAASLGSVEQRLLGSNLFQLDIESVRAQMIELPWVSSVAIEKKIPDELSITIFERQPVALAASDEQFHYVDQSGRRFALLSPAVGAIDLPIVRGAADEQAVLSAVNFLQELGRLEPELYSRVAEITPLVPYGFEIFDRDLSTRVLLGSVDHSEQWKSVYRIAERESLERGALEYADLRFERRVVLMPYEKEAARPAPQRVSDPPAAAQPSQETAVFIEEIGSSHAEE
jgi:cell division septal protein FtsQ